jgi:flagellar basal-body rod protein FlgC
MTSISSSFSAGLSGVRAATTRLAATADNIANAGNVVATSRPAYQERTVLTAPVGGSLPGGVGAGVAVTGVALGSAGGRLAYDPSSPLADGQGLVRLPEVDLAAQMVQLQTSRAEVQANVRTIDAARDVFESILELGRSG